MLQRHAIDWDSIEPLLQNLDFDQIRDEFAEDGVTGVLKLVLHQGGEGAKTLVLGMAKPMLEPVLKRLKVGWDDALSLLSNTSLEKMEQIFTDPMKFVEEFNNKLAICAAMTCHMDACHTTTTLVLCMG